MSIILPSRRSNRPADLPSFRRVTFAREAAIHAFGPQGVQALDHGDFQDRRPDQAPRLLEQVTVKVARETGQTALRYWLNQAAHAGSDEEREAALEIAGEIARLMGLKAVLTGRRAT